MFLSKCAVCNSKKSNFMKEQQARGLSSKLTKKVPILKDLHIINTLFGNYKINETINKLLLPEDKFTEDKYMLEMHLKHPNFVYSACEPSIKTLKIYIYIYIYNFKERRGSRYIYQHKLDKGCVQHGIVYGDFKDLNSRAIPHTVLRDKAVNIATNPNYDDINVDWFQ